MTMECEKSAILIVCNGKGGREVDEIRYGRSDRDGAFGFGYRDHPRERAGGSGNFRPGICQ